MWSPALLIPSYYPVLPVLKKSSWISLQTPVNIDNRHSSVTWVTCSHSKLITLYGHCYVVHGIHHHYVHTIPSEKMKYVYGLNDMFDNNFPMVFDLSNLGVRHWTIWMNGKSDISTPHNRQQTDTFISCCGVFIKWVPLWGVWIKMPWMMLHRYLL